MSFLDELNALFGKKSKSGSIAKDRLQILLVQDRTTCCPDDTFEAMRADIIKVISNYMEIDEDELDINITETKSEDNSGTVPVLYANIPIKSMRRNSGGN